MLLYFKVGNFKSIKDSITINFEATGISEHSTTNVLEKGSAKVLKSVLLYGPNAGGKSKILEAFVIFKNLIKDSASSNSTRRLGITPFRLNAQTKDAPSTFEAGFFIKNRRYRYGFEADENSIKKEWLLEVRPTTETPLFLRIEQNFEINHKKFLNTARLESKCSPNALFLSVADQWNAPLAQEIYSWFNSIFTIHGLLDDEFTAMTNELYADPEYRNQINSLMQHADLGINGVEVITLSEEEKENILKGLPDQVKQKARESLDEEYSKVFVRHNVYDENGKIIEETGFNLQTAESEGTKKFYNLLGTLLYAIKNGRLVVIDEIDARFHTLLTKAIVRLFNSKSVTTGSQLFAACHDVNVMDRELLRRDQIYIIEKDQFAASKAVNLAEYKIARKDTPLSKNYLEGRYGGIPFIENFENYLADGKE